MFKQALIITVIFSLVFGFAFSEELSTSIQEVNQKSSEAVDVIRSTPMKIVADFEFKKYLDYPVKKHLLDGRVLVDDPTHKVSLHGESPEPAELKCYFSEKYNKPYIKTVKKMRLILGNGLNRYKIEQFELGGEEPVLIESFNGQNTRVIKKVRMSGNKKSQKVKNIKNTYSGPKYLHYRFHPVKAWAQRTFGEKSNLEKRSDGNLYITSSNNDSSYEAVVSPSENFMIINGTSGNENSVTEVKVNSAVKIGDLILPADYEKCKYRIVDGEKIPVQIESFTNIDYELISDDECITACNQFPED